jgi:hypothetical protein
LVFFFVFTERAFAASADFNGAFVLGVLEDNAAFFHFDDFVVADRNEEGAWLFKGAEEERLSKRDNFNGVDAKLFIRALFAASDNESAAFSGGNNRFNDWFAGKIHGITSFYFSFVAMYLMRSTTR